MHPHLEAGVRTYDSNFFPGEVSGAAERILARVREQAGGYICAANVHVVVTSWHSPELKAALDQAWMVCPDGAPVAWMMRRTGRPVAQRIAGADLMARVFEIGQPDNLRHFLFGSTNRVLRRLENSLRTKSPKVEIVGQYSPGTLSDEHPEPPETIARIKTARPDIVWCGLGAPKQELWMYEHAKILAPTILIGVGAAFDFHAGTKTRAPEWMQNAGLEWAHRLAAEPRRLAVRYARTNSEFIVRAAIELIRHPSP